MEATVRGNRQEKTITLTKALYKKASIYGSEEDVALSEVQDKHPDFRIVVKAAKRQKSKLAKLTYKDIERYIAEHDDEKGTTMAEYKNLRGIGSADVFGESVTASFFEIKAWFLSKYSEIEKQIEERRNEINTILASA
jgi:hypothetical protein